MIKLGRVISSKDRFMAGGLEIMPLMESTDTRPIYALPASMNLGGGAGFLSVPGEGAIVVYCKLEDSIQISNNLKEDIQNPISLEYDHIWLGAVPQLSQQEKGRNPFGRDKNTPETFDTIQNDYLGRPEGEREVLVDYGIPEAEDVYKDDFLPTVDVWKHPSGHKITLGHKITENGTHNEGILIQSKAGKKIHIDDQPHKGGDTITISDDKFSNALNANRIVLSSAKDSLETFTDRDQLTVSYQGNQDFEIQTGRGSQRRYNKGEGDIEDIVFKGNHFTQAEKNIVRTAVTENITETALSGDIKYQAEKGKIDELAQQEINIISYESFLNAQAKRNISITSLEDKIDTLAKSDISIVSEQGGITIEAPTNITISVPGSVINITPQLIDITTPLSVSVNSPIVNISGALNVQGPITCLAGIVAAGPVSASGPVTSPTVTAGTISTLIPTPLDLATHVHILPNNNITGPPVGP